MEVTGVVMAGGRSLRMGADKLHLLWQGKSFVQRAIDLLSVCCRQVLISYNGEPFVNGLTIVNDQVTNIGPLGGLHACLNASPTHYNLVVAVDMPLLQPEVLTLLLNACEGYDITTVAINGKPEPLCAVYNKNVLAVIEQQIANGQYSLKALMGKCRVRYVEMSDSDSGQLSNVNTPAEFDTLLTS